MVITCATCKFCNPTTESGGECRRNAPGLMPFNGELVWFFPVVNLSATWCGEFIQKGIENA